MRTKKMELYELKGKIDTENYASFLNDDLDDVEKLLDVLELILDQAYVGILFVDPKGIIRFMNQQYEDLIGLDRKKSYGKHITEFFPDSHLPSIIKTKKAQIEFFPDSRLPFIIKTKKVQSGGIYNSKGRGALIVNRIPVYKGKQFIGVIAQCIFRDISEIKEMANRLDLLETKVLKYRKTISDLLVPKYKFDDIIGISEAITHLMNIAAKYAKTENAILVGGETGTGKELFSHSIHHSSRRAEGPLVCVNCASIPNELLESELFGYASGAFTGAQQKGKIGKIELANGGTLFLDEIAELPLSSQAKLLRVIEEKRVERVGGVRPAEVDFRLVVATNRNLDFLKDNRKFRQDLFYRLSTMTIELPALRNRTEDIPILIKHFIRESSTEAIKISDNALHALMDYHWPGNIRELKNIVKRAVSLSESSVLELEHFPPEILQECGANKRLYEYSNTRLTDEMARFEKALLKRTLSCNDGVMSITAKNLGISRSTLYEKCRKHGILRSSSFD